MSNNSEVQSISEKHDKIIFFDYLRTIAMFMILYDHLGALRNAEWPVKTIIDYFICTPLNVIQYFGAMGVSLFFLISGFLFAWNGRYERIVRKTIVKVVKMWFMCVIAGALFWGFHKLMGVICHEGSVFFHSYWDKFTAKQWAAGFTLVGFFTGDTVVTGTNWFLAPLFCFYALSMLYGILYKKIEWKSTFILEIILVVLLFFLKVFKPKVAGYYPYVYMPVSGLLFAELYKRKSDKQAFTALTLMSVLNYAQMVIAFHELSNRYYSTDLYLVSFVYALFLVALFMLFSTVFKRSKICEFCCNISYSIYLCQMTWGGTS